MTWRSVEGSCNKEGVAMSPMNVQRLMISESVLRLVDALKVRFPL